MNSPAQRRRRAQHAARMRIGVLLHRWHRRLGLFASLFLIWLALSGILMNETATLGLDSARVGWPWLMRWYGLTMDVPTTGFVADSHVLTTVGDSIVLDGRVLNPALHAPLGMVASGPLLYVATTDSVLLLKADGTRVDELRSPPLPEAILRRIGTSTDRVAIVDANDKVYTSNDGEEWKLDEAPQIRWSLPQPLTASQRQTAASQARPSLPISRILADAHSGRLFGRFGPAFINSVGLASMLLAISGIWLLWRAARRRTASL